MWKDLATQLAIEWNLYASKPLSFFTASDTNHYVSLLWSRNCPYDYAQLLAQLTCDYGLLAQPTLRLCTTTSATVLLLWVRSLLGILGGPPSINYLSRQFVG